MWLCRGGVLLALLLGAGRALAAEPPVRTFAMVRQHPDKHLFIARINLADPRVSVEIANGGPDPDGPGPWETVLRQPSVIAREHDYAVAINTVFFSHFAADGDVKKYATGEGAAGNNLVVINGKVATRAQDGAALWFDSAGRAHMAAVQSAPPDACYAAAGSNLILQDGHNLADPNDTGRHPRTAAGLSADGKTLVLLVADGRRPGWGIGLTLSELADELIAQGCSSGINFDGGGSSTLVARDDAGRYRVLNTPSDGSLFFVPLSIERPVPYVLGVKIRP